MLDLENLNLVELNAQEVQQVEGGFLFALAILAVFGIIALCGYKVTVS